MSEKIASVDAIEILDSRGNPTIKVFLGLSGGSTVHAAVPSGASKGQFEALEVRDEDMNRYGGKGVRQAIYNIKMKIAPELAGMDPARQAEIDRLLCAIDGTGNKSKLGANAMLGVSMAVARAGAAAQNMPLYRYLAPDQTEFLMPVPMMNVINGGQHADNSVDFQEFMIVPHGAASFAEAMRYGAETYHALSSVLKSRSLTVSVGDEGGFAPDLADNEQACDLIVRAIEKSGFKPGSDIAIALDPAASAFRAEQGYDLAWSRAGLKSSADLIDLYETWTNKFPIVSIEDGVGEDDWQGFAAMTKRLGSKIQIVGDDIYVTNTKFIKRGIAERCSNAALIKLNQIGTVSETINAIEMCRKAGWRTVISHRSGETDDPFIADFAVGLGCGQIKSGAPCRGERLAKYNRLIEIEYELGDHARFESPFGR